MRLLLAESPATAYLIAFLGSGGVIGALIGLFKLRGDKDSMAVTQAQGAMETMQSLNDSLKDSLERANKRTDYYKSQLEAAQDEIAKLHSQWGPFPIEDEL